VKGKVHRILIVSSEPGLTAALRRDLLRASPTLTAIELPMTAERQELELMLTLESPTAVFLESVKLDRAVQMAHWIREADHNLQMIGFAGEIGTDSLLRLMRAGIREWLPVPADLDALILALERIQAEAASHPPSSWSHGQLVSFLPAKPGSGASTIALHVAQECGRALESRALLLDLDLQCGTLGFSTKAAGGLTINEALAHSHQMDAALWSRMVAKTGQFDLLPAGDATDGLPLDPGQLRRIYGFALGRYKLVVADLPGGLEAASAMTLEQSFRIYLVCTTDLASIHLARRKLDLFNSMGVLDKVQVIVNRATFHFGLNEAGLVEILGRKPVCLVPNCFTPLQIALKDGALLDSGAAFVESLAPVVEAITGPDAAARPQRRLPAISVTRTLEQLRKVVSSFRGNGAGPETNTAQTPVDVSRFAVSAPPAAEPPPKRPNRRRGDRRRNPATQSVDPPSPS
jgi:pilus assembly protein CpaE